MGVSMSDEHEPPRGPAGKPIRAEQMTAAERAALIAALMALPVKQRPQIIVFGDDDVAGINPAPVGRPPDT
jgi:hypothetical protein